MRDFAHLPYRMRPEYRRAVRAAAKQSAGMRYRVAAVDYVRGISASAVCRRAS
jgi:hypothetical protein